MRLKSALENVLLTTLVISFIGGAMLVGVAMYVHWNLGHLVEHHLDQAVKRSNLTRTFVHRYGAIVPDKDIIPAEVDLGSWVAWVPIKVFDMGVLVMAFSVFGVFTVVSGKVYLFYWLIGVLSLAILGQFVFVTSLADVRSELHRRVRHRLVHSLREDYEFGAETNNTFSFLMNAAMLMGECCGINSARDFSHTPHTFTHTSGRGPQGVLHNATVLYPLACCRRSYIDEGFLRTLDCALSWSKDAINQKGCYYTAFEYVTERIGPIFMWAYVAITYVEMLQIVVAILLVKVYRDEKRATKVDNYTAVHYSEHNQKSIQSLQAAIESDL